MSALVLLRYWREGVMGLLLIACGLLWANGKGESLRADKWEARALAERSASDAFAARVKATAEEFTRKATQLARDVETKQNQISQEASRDYQARLAALRAHHNRLLANAARGANPGSAGEGDLPGTSTSPSGLDAAASDYAFRCEADAVQLKALQDWVRAQGMAPR